MSYLLHVVVHLSVYAVLAVTLNAIVGYGGLLSFAHSALFLLGAYAWAVLATNGVHDFFLSTGVAAGIGALGSLALAIPAFRFKGDLFVVASMAVQTLIYTLVYNWRDEGAAAGTWRNLTNGAFGMLGLPKPTLFGIEIDTKGAFAALGVGLAIAVIGIAARLAGSPWGRLVEAVRDDERAAAGLGKSPYWVRAQLILLAGAGAGAAGSLFGMYTSFVSPALCSPQESMLLVCMVVVGGAGSVRGSVVGAATLVLLPELLRSLHLSDAEAAQWRLVAYGLLVLAVVHLRPRGIAGRAVLR